MCFATFVTCPSTTEGVGGGGVGVGGREGVGVGGGGVGGREVLLSYVIPC